jgi:hypothetical protein
MTDSLEGQLVQHWRQRAETAEALADLRRQQVEAQERTISDMRKAHEDRDAVVKRLIIKKEVLRTALVTCVDRLVLFTRAVPEHCDPADYSALDEAEAALSDD